MKSAPRGTLAGALYVIATPIGNLEDISLRALRLLKECDLIASEDTRTTKKLLSRYEISTPLTSYHQHSGGKKSEAIALRIESGESVALVSEAGTPAISDPGHELISLCIAKGVKVVPVPGPNAIITLLCASGLNTSGFSFFGFPPRGESERKAFFSGLASETKTMVFYESPNRAKKTLVVMLECLGGRRQVVIGRELTKLNEEIWRGTLEQAVEVFADRRPRGEFVIALAGVKPCKSDLTNVGEELTRLIGEGMDQKSAISIVAKTHGIPRREVYAAALKLKDI